MFLKLRRLLGPRRHVVRVVVVSRLELDFQLLDLAPKIGDDVLVGGDVLIDHFLVWLNLHLDVLGPVCVFQGVDGLLILVARR